MNSASSLREFAIKPVSHTGLFGVFLGACAVEDAVNILHTGVGCKGKTQLQVVHHDWGRESHTRVGWTELREEELIRDPGQPLLGALRELARRRNPKMLLVTASTAVELTGTDFEALCEKAKKQLDCPVVYLPRTSALPDLYQGYGKVIAAMLGLVPWEQPCADEPTVALVGHFFHRHEQEQAANLAELRRLITGLGARPGPVFLGGESLTALEQAWRASLLVHMPYAGISATQLESLSGRKVASCGLPLGIRATSAWLREMSRALGLAAAKVDGFVSREEARATSRLRLAGELLQRSIPSGKVAILADTPSAAGFAALVGELGLTPTLVVLLDRSLGGPEEFESLTRRMTAQMPADLRLVADPTLLELRQLAEAQAFDLVLRPDLGLAGTPWESFPTVETGFPSTRKHFVYPLPDLGYTGAVALAQRIVDAVWKTH
jgi:nitrogenase molybdenum-iron protein alpha/beta subunit